MAGVWVIGTEGARSWSVDYALSGRVRDFRIEDTLVYDENRETNPDDWEDKLRDCVVSQGLHIDTDGHGLYAFVYDLMYPNGTYQPPEQSQ